MPYKIKWEESCVWIEWSGLITYEENLHVNGLIYGDSRFDNLKYQVSNLLDADLSQFEIKNIKVISELDKQSTVWNKKICAIHIAKDPHILNLISEWEDAMKDSGWIFKTLDSIEEAQLWIKNFQFSD